MNRETFFKDKRLPFAEGRYSQDSRRLFKPHMHRRFSIGAVDAGVVIFRVADREIGLRPGALALINPETLHGLFWQNHRRLHANDTGRQTPLSE